MRAPGVERVEHSDERGNFNRTTFTAQGWEVTCWDAMSEGRVVFRTAGYADVNLHVPIDVLRAAVALYDTLRGA